MSAIDHEEAPVGSVLTFDCGTTSLKALVVRPDGSIASEASAGYALHQPREGFAEQSGDEIWAAVLRAGRVAVEAARAVAPAVDAVVTAATWKAILPLDAGGAPLSRASIWMDSRGREQAARLNQRLGRFVGTGQEYWPRAMWFKEHEPSLWSAAEHVVGLNSYLTLKATGELVTEPSDDFVHGSDDAAAAELTEILDAAGLLEDRDRFPRPRPATDVVGALLPAPAEALGIAPGTAVHNGFGDLPAITLGTGSAAPGTAHVYLGSSSWFVHPTTEVASEAPLSFTIAPSLHGAAYVVQSGCLAYDWIVRQVYRAEVSALGDAVNDLVNREVDEIPAGSGDLLATHWINGELPPLSKNAKGLFLNLTALHDRRHMVRAVMESICFAHRASHEAYLASGGAPLGALRVVGGGASSDVWMQMLADVLGIAVEVPANPRHTGALGAAYAVEIGRGRISSFAAVGSAVEVARRFEPTPAAVAVYDRLYPIHADLHRTLHDLFTRLNGDY